MIVIPSLNRKRRHSTEILAGVIVYLGKSLINRSLHTLASSCFPRSPCVGSKVALGTSKIRQPSTAVELAVHSLELVWLGAVR